MKSIKVGLFIALVFTVFGCNSLTQCESIECREAIMLIDVSDHRLFNEIQDDIKQNLPGFMQRTGLSSIDPCQKFTMSFAHLSGKEALEIKSASISISKKGQSRNAEKAQSNPQPIVTLLQKTLTEYQALSNDQEMTSRSNIANTLFKTIIHTKDDVSDQVIMLFSDMVENNHLINFYKKVPREEDVDDAIGKMIDPTILEKFYAKQEEGIITQIIIVLKPEPSGKVPLRDVKIFWTALFKKLKLDEQVQFIDNLTNPVDL